MESGFSYERSDGSNWLYSHPSALFKYGMAPALELRFVWQISSRRSEDGIKTGLPPVALGFKLNVQEESDAVPATSLLVHLAIPGAASKSFKSARYAPSIRLAMQNTISEISSLGYNIGVEWDGESSYPAYIYTLVSGFSLSESTGGYVEFYGFLSKPGKPAHLADLGITFLLRPNIMADCSGGIGLTKSAADYFLALGFSIRLPE